MFLATTTAASTLLATGTVPGSFGATLNSTTQQQNVLNWLQSQLNFTAATTGRTLSPLTHSQSGLDTLAEISKKFSSGKEDRTSSDDDEKPGSNDDDKVEVSS